MDKKVTVTKQETTEIYLSDEEIEQMILLQTGMEGATLRWDEMSCGGIRGCFVKHTRTTTEDA